VPEQLIAMAGSALRLAERSGLGGLGRWVHMLGFRGHFVTKSRGYSTTLGELRNARATYRARQDEPPDDSQVPDEPTVVRSAWQYIGSGYLNPGDVLLAAGSRPPYAPHAKRCSTYAAHHRRPAGCSLRAVTGSREIGETIGYQLRRLRRLRGLTREELADRANVSRDLVAK
jgi:replication initiator protein RepSA